MMKRVLRFLFASPHCCWACLSVLIICCPDNEFKVEPRSALLIRIITSKCIWYLMPIWLIAMGLTASVRAGVRASDLFSFSFGYDPFISFRFVLLCFRCSLICKATWKWWLPFLLLFHSIPRIPSHTLTHKREQNRQRNNKTANNISFESNNNGEAMCVCIQIDKRVQQ